MTSNQSIAELCRIRCRRGITAAEFEALIKELTQNLTGDDRRECTEAGE